MEELVYTYEQYTTMLKEMFVIQGENSDWFLMPDYKHLMYKYNLGPDRCEELLSPVEIKEILELEVKRLNALKNINLNDVVQWIKETIAAKEVLEEAKDDGLEKELLEMIEYYKEERKKTEAETN